MRDSNYPSAKKGEQVDETIYPSAQKSYLKDQTDRYLNKTPNRNQYTASAKKSEAKRIIEDVIDSIKDKKSMNEEAISQVRHVNQEIMSNFGFSGNHRAGIERQRTAQKQIEDSSRDPIATSVFEWRHSTPLDQSQRDSEASQQNITLRSRLNDELKKNNELLKYIAGLEAENSRLKATRHDQSSTHLEISHEHLQTENRQLRSQLASNQDPHLLQQLQYLKEQNKHLRADTIALLKSKQP